MSAEVESGLTAARGAEEKSQSQGRSEGAHLLQGESGEQPHGDGHGHTEADTHKKCKENDKENEQSSSSSADSAVEAVKRKVVEAPPPKVNPWTKRTTGRVPINNITTSSSSSQEKGDMLIRNSLLFSVQESHSCRSTLHITHFDSFMHLNPH